MYTTVVYVAFRVVLKRNPQSNTDKTGLHTFAVVCSLSGKSTIECLKQDCSRSFLRRKRRRRKKRGRRKRGGSGEEGEG